MIFFKNGKSEGILIIRIINIITAKVKDTKLQFRGVYIGTSIGIFNNKIVIFFPLALDNFIINLK